MSFCRSPYSCRCLSQVRKSLPHRTNDFARVRQSWMGDLWRLRMVRWKRGGYRWFSFRGRRNKRGRAGFRQLEPRGRFDGRSFQWRWRSCLKSGAFLYYSAGIPGQLMILFETGLLHLMERQRRCPEPNNFCQRSCKDELLWRVGPTNNSLQRCVSVGRSGRYVVSIPPILFFETGKPTRVRAMTPRYLSEERVKTDVAVVKREPRVYPHFQEVRSIIVAKVVVMVIGPNE